MLASSNHSLAAAGFAMLCEVFPVASQCFSDKGKGWVGGPELVQWWGRRPYGASLSPGFPLTALTAEAVPCTAQQTRNLRATND